MAAKPIENLKGFTANRPPFVVFTVCILLFAIALISLGAYVNKNEIPNYDIDYDWNKLLMGFSSLEFCILPNDTAQPSEITTTTSSSLVNTTSAASTTAVPDLLEELEGPAWKNVSLGISVSLRAHSEVATKVHTGTTYLFSRFTSSDLGFEGGSDQVYITFELDEPLKKMDCLDAGCNSGPLSACLTIIGPKHVFPMTRHPTPCNASETIKQDTVTKMNIKPAKLADPVQWCNDGAVANANHQFDPKLTVMLSSAERSIINLHLMYTSYFLFVMLVTCVCYALIKGPPGKHRTITHTATSEKKISAPI